MAPRPFVLRASRCRFAAARRAGASMQMSRVMQQSFNRTFKSKLPTTHKANCMATVGFRQLHNNCWGGLLHQHSCRNMSQYCDHMMSFMVRCLRLHVEHAGTPIVVSRGASFASLHRGFARCKHCCVSQLFSHRFAAAGHVGALMSMSRVVVLVHLGLPCWCFVAQRTKTHYVNGVLYERKDSTSIVARRPCSVDSPANGCTMSSDQECRSRNHRAQTATTRHLVRIPVQECISPSVEVPFRSCQKRQLLISSPDAILAFCFTRKQTFLASTQLAHCKSAM